MADGADDDVLSPKTADYLLGHDEAEADFLAAHSSGRLHHAWMISGPRGIGKATLAYRIARFLLTNPPESGDGGGLFGDLMPKAAPTSLDVSPDHPVVRRILAGGHGDLVTIQRGTMPDGRPRSEIVIDDVRQLGQFFTKTSSEGGWRVAIVDSADELNRNAANALLKVLEEPPSNAMILLVAHAPGRVLPTILSRCRRLSLRPLASTVTEDFLGRHMPGITTAERRLLASLAEGSPGVAISIAQADGLAIYHRLLNFLANLPQVSQRDVLEMADSYGGRGGDDAFRVFGQLLTDLLSRVIRRASGAQSMTDIPDEAEVLDRLASIASLDPWIEVWEKITGLIQRTDAINLDRKQIIIAILNDIAAVTRL